MNEQQVRAEIARLEALAQKAYDKRDFQLENKYDKQLAELRAKLNKVPPAAPKLKKGECREHHWDPELLAQYGNARCEICHMQHRYFIEGLANLAKWSEEEKKTAEYARVADYYKCKVHRHDSKLGTET